MHRLLRRYRWGLLVLAGILLLFVGRGLYDALLPMEGWLTRGWYALRDQNYPLAERCFLRAARKSPKADLPQIALSAVYTAESSGEKAIPKKLSPFLRLPWLGDVLEQRQRERFAARQHDARKQMQSLSYRSRYGAFVHLEVLFADDWRFDPEAFGLLLAGLREARLGHADAAWRKISTLLDTYPRVYRNYCRLDRNLVLLVADSAWRAGAVTRARALSAGSTDASADHIRLSAPDPGSPATVWWSAPDKLRPYSPDDGNLSPHSLLLLPAPGGAWMMREQGRSHPLQWLRWHNGTWQAMPTALCNALDTQVSLRNMMLVWGVTSGKIIRVGNVTYLLLSGASRPLLATVGTRLTPIEGYSPRTIASQGGELWVDNGYDLTRRGRDGFDVQYRGRQVTQIGGFLGGTETQSWLPFTIDPAWTPATDRAGALWLVSWDGIDLIPRAAWTGTTFRPATVAEIAAAKGGLIDVSGCIRRPAELPKGFKRDAWRHVSGLPANTEQANYAVDCRGRVWMTSGYLAARWAQTGWVSIANRFPGPKTTFGALAPAGNGVLVSIDGGAMVGYLE